MNALEIFVSAHPLWAWLAIAAVLLAVELATGPGWLLWPAGSAAVAGVASGVWPHLGATLEIVLFAALTIVSTYLGRRFTRPRASGGLDINDPHARLIGHRGQTVTPFAAGGGGRVFVDGKEWPAEVEGGGALAPGAKVEVTAILGGARLRVRAA